MPNRRSLTTFICGMTLVWVLPMAAEAQGIPQNLSQEVLALGERIQAVANEGRHDEAKRMAEQAIAQWERSRYPALAAYLCVALSHVYEHQVRWDEAERQATLGLRLLGNPPADELIYSDVINQLGNVHYRQRRFAEAEKEFRQSLAIIERRLGRQSPAYAAYLVNLANTLTDSGRFLEGEAIYKQAIVLQRQLLGRDDAQVGNSYLNLGMTLQKQLGRWEEGEPYLQEALRIHTLHQDRFAMESALLSLAKSRGHGGHWEEAEKYLKRRKQVLGELYGPNHPLTLDDAALADLYFDRQRFIEAADAYRRSLITCAQAYGKDSKQYADRLVWLAYALDYQPNETEAEEVATQAIQLVERLEGNWDLLSKARFVRASCRSDQRHFHEAITDYREAIRCAELARSQLSGSDLQRAESFASSYRNYYFELAWHLLQVNEPAEALVTAERGRARALVDQIELAHADLLAGVPPAEARALQVARQAAVRQVAALEQSLTDLQNSSDDSRRKELYRSMALARQQLVDADTAIRNASPLYRQVLSKDFEPVSLEKLEAWLTENKLCMLTYGLSAQATYVITYGAGKRNEPVQVLNVSEAQAKILGMPAGWQANSTFAKALIDKDGLMPMLADPEKNDQAIPKLAALWEVLIPADIRAALLHGDFAGLVIVPDGALATLPFEALVVETAPTTEYFLDVGPPIIYAPSATILYNLAKRGAPMPPAEGKGNVLTVGDVAYDRAAGAAGGTMRSRFGALGGKLLPLPYTGTESRWVKDVLDKAGFATTQLTRARATEGNVRQHLTDSQIVHLACHGLADDSFGNFFGALALSQSPQGGMNSADDGFLALPEICELDLRRSELVILSACQTNYGPHLQGEGAWALTRGFLVAGSRRVVASDWIVDDKATAHLVSYFSTYIGKDYQAGELPKFAQALQQAKRGVREQGDWSKPYFWAPLVLVGPN